VETLVLERHPRVGDGWRRRYPSLVLHDPVWANHLPYVPFPDTWPVYLPKDKLADWFEAYVSIMELNVWTEALITRCRYDEPSRRWSVTVARGAGPDRELTAGHLVLATGHSGMPRVPEIEGRDRFAGEIVHSSAFACTPAMAGRPAVVVGAGNSAHDIAQELVRAGAKVTMVQRSRTQVAGRDTLLVPFRELYNNGLTPVDDIDHVMNSWPLALSFEVAREIQPYLVEADGAMRDRLSATGYRLNEDETLGELYLTRGGGYYIDVGAATDIIEGRIGIRSGVGVACLSRSGVVLDDGSEVDADLLVLATGYGDMREAASEIVGAEIADALPSPWGLDEDGGLRIGRPSGHERLWFLAGNLALVRHVSRMLALQIAAREDGLVAD
jgi:putative flavoprotein involved in K+ transport